MTPISKELNEASVRIASALFPMGFDVRTDAPDTFEAVRDSLQQTGRLAIWAGDYSHSAFASSEVWHEFRAWHDWTHARYDLRFNIPQEHGVCHVQAAWLIRLYGKGEATARMIAVTFCTIIDTLEQPLAGRDIADGWEYARDNWEAWLPYARWIMEAQGPTDLDAIRLSLLAYATRAEIGPAVPQGAPMDYEGIAMCEAILEGVA